MRATAAIVLAAVVTLAGGAPTAGYGAPPSVAKDTHPTVSVARESGGRSLSVRSLAQALTEIRLLNAQRQANGIPGDLQNVPKLSEGCRQYTNEYEYDFRQYPHTEIPGQRGYTVWGQRAAESSDLAPGVVGMWGTSIQDDIWASAPLHLTELFAPAARYAWYGSRVGAGGNIVGTPYGVCMGTGEVMPFAPSKEAPSEAPSETPSEAPSETPSEAQNESQSEVPSESPNEAQSETPSETPEAPAPTFFSLPGNGVRGVPPAEYAEEGPFTPEEAAHMRSNRYTGYNIILFDVGPRARLVSVTLTRPGGHDVRVRVVGPDTPAPKSPVGWPSVSVVGAYSGNDRFVIPVQPMAGKATYTLRALWAWGADGHERKLTQRVAFTTGCRLGKGSPFIQWPRVHGCKHLSEVSRS